MPARPLPVTRPILAQMYWTTVMSGNVRTAVQRSPYPKAAPALAYVPMPLGSSSEAPVMNPGPSRRNRRRIGLRSRPRDTTRGWGGRVRPRPDCDLEAIEREDRGRLVAAGPVCGPGAPLAA